MSAKTPQGWRVGQRAPEFKAGGSRWGAVRQGDPKTNSKEERVLMVDRQRILDSVEAAAQSVLGDRAAEWMVRPNAMFDGMAPAELAVSPEGARVVLHELEQPSTRLRARRLQTAAERARREPPEGTRLTTALSPPPIASGAQRAG